MSDKKIRELVLEIILAADYDLYKSFIPKYSELPEEDIEYELNGLMDIVKKYIANEQQHHTKKSKMAKR